MVLPLCSCMCQLLEFKEAQGKLAGHFSPPLGPSISMCIGPQEGPEIESENTHGP